MPPDPANTAVLRLAIPAPLRRLFDYLPPGDGDGKGLQPGCCLRVPFGRREVTAVIVEAGEGSATPEAQLRPALRALDEAPLLPASIVDLCVWAADYYRHPIGEVFAAALPRHLRDGKALPQDAWRLTLRGRGLAPGALQRAPSQARAISLLQQDDMRHDALRAAGVSAAVLRELRARDLIERCSAGPSVPGGGLREAVLTLAREQRAVVEAIAFDGFRGHLLEGVTGSGKTEVYLQLIQRCLEAGRQALVLIPEIGLTPQTLARFTARFDCRIEILHSGLAGKARLAAWQAARSGEAGVVIGTRSAVLTPLARPGLIVVDEEHDASYKQQDGFRYSARDVAVKRAQLEKVPVLLGSATPSLESLYNASRGRYDHHRLESRRGEGRPPTLRTVDLRGLPLDGGLSEVLVEAVRQTVVEEQKQALLFLNRRGFAPTLQCHDCGWVAGCDNCDARLTVHLRRRQLRCHHCGAGRVLVAACPACGGTRLLTQGLGTEQAEARLARLLPCPVHRVDSDALRGPDAMTELLAIASAEEPCVILGTQMLTKGHHFPAVQLVGIIDADALLFSADFRGEERMAQLITQVAGRAGRASAGGRVLIQTHHPQNPLFATLLEGGYGAVADSLLAERQQRRLPPAGQLALLRADAPSERDAEDFLARLRGAVAGLPEGATVIGPLPSSMPRRAGRFRWQLWCLGDSREAARGATAALVAAAETLRRPRNLNWFVDVDPSDVS